MKDGLRVTVWNEGVHDKRDRKVMDIYPEGMGKAIAGYLAEQPGIASVRVAELGDKGQGLTDTILAKTDVMTWWGHCAHDQVTDENAAKVKQCVLEGMGWSSHSAISPRCSRASWAPAATSNGAKSARRTSLGGRLAHPIAEASEYFSCPIPKCMANISTSFQPDQLVFISWFEGGGCSQRVLLAHGRGRSSTSVPATKPPIYHNETVLRVIYNGIRWAAPSGLKKLVRGNVQPLENVNRNG